MRRARSSSSKLIPAAEARSRFERAIDFTPLPVETVALADALERVLAADLAAPTDVPAFDRSGVDGFAVRAADTAGAADRAPRRLMLNAEVIACGHRARPGSGARRPPPRSRPAAPSRGAPTRW